jgi:hypothetical protein
MALWGVDESSEQTTHVGAGDKPRYMAIDSLGNQLANTMGANTAEASTAGVTSAGWQHVIRYTNTSNNAATGLVTRKRFETLVATKSLTGVPAGDDVGDV